jgi:hypothetical protein
LATASISFNDAIPWFVRVANDLETTVIENKRSNVGHIALENPTWNLLSILSTDVSNMIVDITGKMSTNLQEHISSDYNVVRILFGILLICSGIAVVLFYFKGIPNLLQRVMALTSLLCQIPESFLRDLPELHYTVETHAKFLGGKREL